jgi:AraC-like DNA-binding protein
MQLACLFIVFFLQLRNSPEIAPSIVPLSAALNLDPPHKTSCSIICYCSRHNPTYVPTQLLTELNVSAATCSEYFSPTLSYEITSRIQKGDCNKAQRQLIQLYLFTDMRNASRHVNYGTSRELCTIAYYLYLGHRITHC